MSSHIKRLEIFKGNESDGFIIPAVLSFMIALSIITAAVVMLIDSNNGIVARNIDSQRAFNIAEAGINYYTWHLSHAPSDLKDGQTTPSTPDPTLGYGPYVHNYIDSDGNTTGTYTLWIKNDTTSAGVTTVRSIGKVSGTNKVRTIDAKIGAKSFASYGVVSDSALWFGPDETADGPVHSNQGIEMDGQSTDTVSSANSTYVPPNGLHSSNYANGLSHPGVWCDAAVTSPVNCNTRDKSNWKYPVTSVDFNVVDSSLCSIKKIAFASDPATAALATGSNPCSQTPTTRTASYLPQRSSNGAFSTKKGYFIQLNSNGTYDVSLVNGEDDTQATYTSALTLQSLATGLTIPTNGVIYVEDNVWVRTNPTFHGRVTLAAGRQRGASQNTEFTIVGNMKYANKDGSDVIGLIAEDTITIAPYAPPSSGSFNFEVDAAVIGDTGAVEFPSEYRAQNNKCTRGWVSPTQTYTYYGSVATRQTWTWSWQWGSSCGDNVKDPSSSYYISGFKYNTTTYDRNLLYSPPPNWPTTGQYQILSWREVLISP